MNRKNQILITRPEKEAKELAKIIGNLGLAPIICPMIKIEYIKAPPPAPLSSYDGIIFTSTNAVRSIGNSGITTQDIADTPVYAVGKKTAKAAHHAGFANIHIPDTNTYGTGADALAKYIADIHPGNEGKKFLHIRGKDVHKSIKELLLPYGHITDEYITYKAHTIKKLPNDVIQGITQNKILAVLLFSRRTAHAFADAIYAHSLEKHMRTIKALSIGKSVLEYPPELDWEKTYISGTPDTEGMVKLIKSTLLPDVKNKTATKQDIKELSGMSTSNISTSNKRKPLKNAVRIIESFGGVRPMSGKIGVAPTTVQGWKKRNTIPAGRIEMVLKAARDNNIDLSSLIEGFSDPLTADIPNDNHNTNSKENESKSKKETSPSSIHNNSNNNNNKDKTDMSAADRIAEEIINDAEKKAQGNTANKETAHKEQEAKSPTTKEKTEHTTRTTERKGHRPPYPPHSSTPDPIMVEIEKTRRKSVMSSTFITLGAIALTAAVGTYLLWPTTKKVQEHDTQIKSLEQNVARLDNKINDIDNETKSLKGMIPDNVINSINKIQGKAKILQNTVDQISEKTKGLDELLGSFSGSENLSELITRLKEFETSAAGQQQLAQAVEELKGLVNGINGKVNDLDTKLMEAKSGNGALGETIGGVSNEDLKAAAMLIAFSKLRESLNREAPFEEDLALLQKIAGKDNPELQEALARLAPHAKDGILTTKGLAREFKGLAGDVLVSSLKGEDLSVAEKAKARFSQAFKVEKNGEPLLNTTDTAAVISKAQKLLDSGDVKGAMAQLQTLDGQAAQKLDPFMQQAEATLLSEEIQKILGKNILSGTTGSGISSPAIPEEIDMDRIKDTLGNMIPKGTGNKVIKDEKSGFVILPKKQGINGIVTGN